MSKGKVFIISAPSGTGKGTIINRIFELRSGTELSVSATTRKPREGEVDGKHYHFLSMEQFDEMIDNDQFLEYAVYAGNKYGTPLPPIIEKTNKGIHVILEIEVQGALKVQEIFPETKMIFVVPPSMAELKKRLVERGREDEERINARLLRAKEELLLSDRYAYIVVNDVLEQCIDDVRAIIKKAESEKTLVNNLLNEEY